MRLSFIVTLDAGGLGDACLDGLRAAALPGDEVIVVAPRGVSLGTSGGARRVVWRGPEARKTKAAVDWRALRLGAQPRPGAAVLANVGLSQASGDAVVFLAGDARPEPAGLNAARALLAETAADMVIGRFSGPDAGDEAAAWQAPDRDAALRMEAEPGRMMLRRSFLLAADLRHAEHLPTQGLQAFHLQACLRARDIRFHDGIMLHLPGPAAVAADVRVQIPDALQEPEARATVFALYREVSAALGPHGPHAALRHWLARQVGRDLALLPPEDFWRYFETADPALLAGDWPDGRGGRALATLAAHPAWQAVATLQGEAIWRSLADRPDQEAPDGPSGFPRPHAVSRAIALWRGLRAGSGGFGGSGDTDESATSDRA